MRTTNTTPLTLESAEAFAARMDREVCSGASILASHIRDRDRKRDLALVQAVLDYISRLEIGKKYNGAYGPPSRVLEEIGGGA